MSYNDDYRRDQDRREQQRLDDRRNEARQEDARRDARRADAAREDRRREEIKTDYRRSDDQRDDAEYERQKRKEKDEQARKALEEKNYALYYQLMGGDPAAFSGGTASSAPPPSQEVDPSSQWIKLAQLSFDEMKAALSAMLAPEVKEQIIGMAEVRDVFRSSKFGAIAGCIVTTGAVRRANPIRVLRNNIVIYEGQLESLRRFRDDVNEVKSGTECGIGVKDYNDVKPGDQIEVFERITLARSI